MEGKFGYSKKSNDNKGDDNEQQQNTLQIKKYDSRSQIFNDNDSFIAIEEQAMREEVENEQEINPNQELQNEIDQLKTSLDEALEEKNDALQQIASKDAEIEKLNGIIQNLQIELKRSEDKNAALNKQFSQQRDLNSDLSLRVQELKEALDDKNKNSGILNNNPDQIIHRNKALELQNATLKHENEKLNEEMDAREKHFVEELTRLTQEISNAHSENTNFKSTLLMDSSNEKPLESELATLRNQFNTMTDTQKSLSDSLQLEIDTNTRLNSDLTSLQENLEKLIKENANMSSVIDALLEATNVSDPFDLIVNVRRLQSLKNGAQQANQELCKLQVSYEKEVIINEQLRKDLSDLKTLFLEEISNKSNDMEAEKETIDSTIDQNFIHELKSDYENRLTAERERTLSQKKKMEAIKIRDRQIAEKFASIPEVDHTDMIQSLIVIFESLSANSNTISDSNDEDVEGTNDRVLNDAIEQAQEIALKFVPHDLLLRAVDQLELYQKCLDEIFAKTVQFNDQFKAMNGKFEMMEKIVKQSQVQKIQKMQRFQRLPQSSQFLNKSDSVTINRNSTNNSKYGKNANSTFDFNIDPDHSALSFSRSPISASTPKAGMRRQALGEKGNSVNPLAADWRPRASPSNDFAPPSSLF